MINLEFGYSLPHVSNVMFFNGNLDPWADISRTEPWPRVNDDVTVEVIEGEAHCPNLTTHHDQIISKIESWIQKKNDVIN